MNRIDAFFEALTQHPTYVRVQQLKATILSRPEYQERFSRYLEKQKKHVQKFPHSLKSLDSLTPDLHEELSAMSQDPLISEYLDLLDELNDLVQNIQEMINLSL
ncbi:MAG: YlbF family regulator, partial [Candidatus Izemoplasmatales bacterium]|nr:YlbF family regulator [Candidatus Izemoplasmatales bacterium]